MAKARSRKSSGNARQPKGCYCAVAGVTHEGRQRVIKKHCREGDEVELEPEPENRHSDHAVAVWVRKRAWIFRGWAKVGYIPEEESGWMFRLLQNDWIADASIHHVVGGGLFKSLGLRIQVELRPGEWESA